MSKLTKSQAIQKVKAHLKTKGKNHAVTGQPGNVFDLDIGKLKAEGYQPNPAEEIAILQIGINLGIFTLDDLDQECRNLLGDPHDA
jgi:hypothetical protein